MGEVVGHVRELWRYPVKSMLGERLEEAAVSRAGVAGDRSHAVRDRVTGDVLSAKRVPALFGCTARSRADGGVDITWPDATSSDGDLEARMTQLTGRNADLVRASLERAYIEMGEDSTTTEGPPSRVLPPAGTFFDSASLHLLTCATLARLDGAHEGAFDRRRFRPNLLVDTGPGADGFVERTWCRRDLLIGAQVRLSVMRPCKRCVMVTHAQDDLPRDRGILATVARVASNEVGVLCEVAREGTVCPGDEVVLL